MLIKHYSQIHFHPKRQISEQSHFTKRQILEQKDKF